MNSHNGHRSKAMKLDCRDIHKVLGDFHAGKLSGPRAASVEEHLSRCEACRCEARRRSLARVLDAGARAPVPEPSAYFMTRLYGALDDCPPPRPAPVMSELLMRSGLRLAPAMAALVMLISIGSAFLAAPPEDAQARVPAEELLLADHPLSADLLLAAITGETIER